MSHLLNQSLETIDPRQSVNALEAGTILFFPDHYYQLADESLRSESILHRSHKNVSYDYTRKKLGAFNKNALALESKLTQLMSGYAEFAHKLIQQTLPGYVPYLKWGRTSFRPAQVCDRVTSKRKDDTRLHVDSFSATPVNSHRILRVFCNINPDNQPRVWHVGEPFADVLKQFAPRIRPYSKLCAHVLKLVKTTKTLRSPYDHYMLHLHDSMKRDDHYQAHVNKTQIDFPALSSWIVYTDHVSHAALSGQHLLEQTFYLPVDKMANPSHSPLHEWNKFVDIK